MNGSFSLRPPDPRGEPVWLRPVEHTADAGLRVRATTLAGVFERAAWGMFALLGEPWTVRPVRRFRLEVRGPDREALLVRWLTELNYRHLTQGLFFSRFRVVAWSDRRLVAVAAGEKLDPDRHVVWREIKAVTFHQLRIARAGGEWEAQVLFDL